MTIFIIFVSVIAILFLVLNLLFAPHNPYAEKFSSFECGFHSFLGQNRSQFNIKFFIFGLVFLLFDLEITLIFPFAVSQSNNEIYGLIIVLIFMVIITIGFVYELGKGALKIDSKQNITSSINNQTNTSISFIEKVKPRGTNNFSGYSGGGVNNIGRLSNPTVIRNMVNNNRFYSSKSKYSKYSKYSLYIRKFNFNLLELTYIFTRKLINIVFFILPLSFIGRAYYLSLIVPDLVFKDALLKISGDYISGGIFAGSLLISFVTSLMEFNKIPDVFHIFSTIFKHIDQSNKIDTQGVLKMDNNIESKKFQGKDFNSQSSKEILKFSQNHAKQMNLLGIERFKLENKILGIDSEVNKLPY